MMFGSPFFSDYDSEYYPPQQYYRPISRQEQRRRAIAKEEALRRAELERYYQLQELELQKQRQYEYQQQRAREERRRRRREIEEEKAYQEYLRFQQEKEREERQRKFESLRRFYEHNDDNEDADEETYTSSDESSMSEGIEQNLSMEDEPEPVYQLMRGRDGRIYKVLIGSQKQNQKPNIKNKKKKTHNQNLNRNRHHHNHDHLKIPRSPQSDDEHEIQEKSDEEYGENFLLSPTPIQSAVSSGFDYEATDFNGNNKKTKKKMMKKKLSSLGKKKQRIHIVVEDASDSENENEFYNSPWRNRRPSPGQWIEPVENVIC